MNIDPLEYLRALETETEGRDPAMRALTLHDPRHRPPGSLGAQAWIWAGMVGTPREMEDEEDNTGPGEDRILARLARLPGLVLADREWLDEAHRWRLLALPTVPCSPEWRAAYRELDYPERDELWDYLLRTCQTAKCRAVWKASRDEVHHPTCHDTDWATLTVLLPDVSTWRPEIDLRGRRPIRECVLQGLTEMGYRVTLPVHQLADYRSFNRELVLDLLRRQILQLAHLEVPWWISPEGREYWQELDALVPGWTDATRPLLSQVAEETTPETRVSLLASLGCPEARVPVHLRRWLAGEVSYPGEADAWYHPPLPGYLVAYLLLCGHCEERDGRYLFLDTPVHQRDWSHRHLGQTLIIFGKWGAYHTASREIVEEFILPLRESWHLAARGKSARSGDA